MPPLPPHNVGDLVRQRPHLLQSDDAGARAPQPLGEPFARARADAVYVPREDAGGDGRHGDQPVRAPESRTPKRFVANASRLVAQSAHAASSQMKTRGSLSSNLVASVTR